MYLVILFKIYCLRSFIYLFIHFAWYSNNSGRPTAILHQWSLQSPLPNLDSLSHLHASCISDLSITKGSNSAVTFRRGPRDVQMVLYLQTHWIMAETLMHILEGLRDAVCRFLSSKLAKNKVLNSAPARKQKCLAAPAWDYQFVFLFILLPPRRLFCVSGCLFNSKSTEQVWMIFSGQRDLKHAL